MPERLQRIEINDSPRYEARGWRLGGKKQGPWIERTPSKVKITIWDDGEKRSEKICALKDGGAQRIEMRFPEPD